jgi:two-component system copper resistance phosphate regulon response regulator CusR
MEDLNNGYSTINGQERSNFKILVIEDDSKLLQAMCAFLKNCGFTNHTHAKTGINAIQLYAREKFDLVVLDIGITDMDGFMAGAAMKGMERYREFYTPIIAVSAFDPHQWKDALKAGIDDYMVEPHVELEKKVVDRLSQLTAKRIN